MQGTGILACLQAEALSHHPSFPKMHPFRKPLATLAAVLSLAACGPQDSTSTQTPVAVEDSRTPAQREAERTPYELDAAFAQAAREFDVPAELLKAYSYAETRWEMVRGSEEFEGMPAAYGLMALRGAKLTEGARLAGESEEAVRTRPEANIRAAAALLSSYADELKVDRADLGAWAPAAVKLSGISSTDAQAQFIHQGVYGVLPQAGREAGPQKESRCLAATVEEPRKQRRARVEGAGLLRRTFALDGLRLCAVWRQAHDVRARCDKSGLAQGWEAFGVGQIRAKVTEMLRVRQEVSAYAENVVATRWGAVLGVVASLLAAAPLAEAVVEPIWKLHGHLPPEPARKLAFVGAAFGIVTAVVMLGFRWSTRARRCVLKRDGARRWWR